MASKYVAAQDFDGFKEGDDITIAQAGDNTEQWLQDGKIRERDAETAEVSVAPQPSNPDLADATNLMVEGAATPQDEAGTPDLSALPNLPVAQELAASSYVTLASSVDGMPRFQTVDPPKDR